jgi:hypothetical protein
MISPELIAECRGLVADVAPEIDGNCYVIDASLLDGLAPSGGCLGFAFGPTTHIFEVRERLSAAGIWEGAKPVIALSAHDIADASDYGDRFRLAALNVVIHETAHLLPYTPAPVPERLLDISDSPSMREFQRQQVEVGEIIDKTAEPDHKYNSHNSAFIRRSVHLYARARMLGWSFPSTNLFGGDAWFCSQPAHYLEQLFVEVFEHQDASFEDIEATDPPAEFTKLWDYNVDFYQSFRDQKE